MTRPRWLPPPTLGAAAWVLGVMAGTVALPAGRPAAVVGTAAVLVAGAALGAALLTRPALPPLLAAALLAGLVRAAVPAAAPLPIAAAHALAGRDVVVTGTVTDDPRPLAVGAELLVQPSTVRSATSALPAVGRVLVRVRAGSDAAIGDVVQAAGRLQLPASTPDFDRRAYLLQRGVTLELAVAHLDVVSRAGGVRALPGRLRDSYRSAVAALLPAPHAAVLVGIVLGVRTGIPPELSQALVATGLVHLLVLSGLKVAVFARLVTAGLAPLLGRAAAPLTICVVAVYALAGGATPAAVRAAAMGAVAILARWLGRPAHVWTSLAWTAAAMLAWRPELAWDVGFQLSFAGTAAIILLTPAIERRLHRLPGLLREPFAVTLAAQVGTLPMTAAGFHVLSPVAPLANALTLPLLPALVGAGLLLAPLAAVPEAGRLAALPLVGLLAYVEQVAQILARVPAAAVPISSFPAWAGVAYYGAVGGAVAAWRARGRRRRAAAAFTAVLPLLVGGAELASWLRPPPTAAVLNVGEGEAMLVSGPEGALLVGGGPSAPRLAAELGSRLPPWHGRLAALVIDGGGAGQVGGLAGSGVAADRVLVPATDPGGSAWRTAAVAQAAGGARVVRLTAGDVVDVAGFALEVLAPEPGTPAGVAGAGDLALRIHRARGPAVCTFGHLDTMAQAAAATHLRGRCDTLVLPGEGRSAPAPTLLAAARPAVLVASTGTGRLARGLSGGNLRRTDQEGTVVVDV